MTTGNRIWAVIPVKRFSTAKARLASVLDIGERAELARVMFEDVHDALLQCQDILAGTLVVTWDPEVAALARRRGASVVPERRAWHQCRRQCGSSIHSCARR